MSELSKIICSKIDQVPTLGIYSLILLANAFSQSTYVEVRENNISHKG